MRDFPTAVAGTALFALFSTSVLPMATSVTLAAVGRDGIGRFGLMDGEGIFAYGGICPPEPSAWATPSSGSSAPCSVT